MKIMNKLKFFGIPSFQRGKNILYLYNARFPLIKKLPPKGKYDDGKFGGGGSQSLFTQRNNPLEYVKDTIYVPIKLSFNEAFANARKQGLDTFLFNGQLKTTELGNNPDSNEIGSKRFQIIGVVPVERTVKKNQKGGLVNKQYSGTWGNRGQGNELQSALENGLSWTWDKIYNAGDYIEQGLGLLVGLIPGDTSLEEFVLDIKNKQLARNSGESGYTNSKGDYILLPMAGTPPPLPGLPKNPSTLTLAIRNRMIPVRKSLAVRESLLKAAGLLDKLPQTKTYKLYHQLQKEFDKSLKPTKSVDNTILTKRQTASFKAEKARVTDDLRSVNSGRSSVKERQWDEVERMIRKDPKVAGIVQRYDRKIAQGMDYKALRAARIKMLLDYIKTKPGFFDWLK